MELRQKLELRKLLAPELRQSLKVLTMALLDVKQMVETELEDNPFLEETSPKELTDLPPTLSKSSLDRPTPSDSDIFSNLMARKASLEDILLRQLGMFTETDEEFKIGQQIVGNIDDNGYLKVSIEEIAATLGVKHEDVEKTLKLVQQFDPAGVGARTVSECLMIQLNLSNEKDSSLREIIECCLDDVAKKNYTLIAKKLKKTVEEIKPLIHKIQALNPKPGRNYSPEEAQRIIPDITIELNDEDLPEAVINNESLPTLFINRSYQEMLKKENLDPKTKEYLENKLRNAMELMRAIAKRQTTLRKVMDTVMEIQLDALTQEDLSLLKPITFEEVAKKIGMHESTVCRVVMNKYVKTSVGIVALKDFFTSHVHAENGESVSSNLIKKLINEFVSQEDKKHPLSDEDIVKILAAKNQLKVARRTVAKYREELKLLSSTYRKER